MGCGWRKTPSQVPCEKGLSQLAEFKRQLVDSVDENYLSKMPQVEALSYILTGLSFTH